MLITTYDRLDEAIYEFLDTIHNATASRGLLYDEFGCDTISTHDIDTALNLLHHRADVIFIGAAVKRVE